MFFRRKRVGSHDYLQIVRNQRVDGRHRQSVVATLGRVADLERDGTLARLLRSGARVLSSDIQSCELRRHPDLRIRVVRARGPQESARARMLSGRSSQVRRVPA